VSWGDDEDDHATSKICRAQHHGAILAGATEVASGKNGADVIVCVVGFVGKIHRLKHILSNIYVNDLSNICL
jgi:glycine cleavage system pyridoxal-binding protein P